MRNGIYHYTESGLDTVFLKGGFDFQNTAGEKTVVIHDVEGLHKAIGTALVCHPYRLTGKEFRYLRSELLLSQASLAKILGVKELTIGRWEKEQTEIPLAAEAIVRLLFAEGFDVKRKSKVRELLELIADLDDEIDRTLTLQKKQGTWTTAMAA